MISRKKKNRVHKSSDKAFKNMWTAHNKSSQYNSLCDENTEYYFASPSVQKHIKNLYIDIKKHPMDTVFGHKTSQLSELTKGILKSQHKIWHQLQDKDTHIQIKIKPYCQDLRDSSTCKLDQFKENLKANRRLKNYDHKAFIKAQTCNIKPETPKIKVIKTLDSLNLTKIR